MIARLSHSAASSHTQQALHSTLNRSIHRHKLPFTTSSFRLLSTEPTVPTSRPSEESRFKIKINGGREYDDLKQYLLLQSPKEEIRTSISSSSNENFNQTKTVASLYVKRNIIFGTAVHQSDLPYVESCRTLLELASTHAGQYGDQPQMMARLRGLSSYIRHHIDLLESSSSEEELSKAISKLNQDRLHKEDGKVTWDAVESIARQVPRPGSSEVGSSTYRDARSGWEEVAKEYAVLTSASSFGDEEAKLYLDAGAVLVQIENVYEDSQRDYILDSGGFMARFFLV